MKMIDWSKWSAIAEILSGIAVVATLVILILGVQENTDITRASMYSDVVADLNETTRDIYRNPELTRLWGRFVSDEDLADLSVEEQIRLEQMVRALFRTYDSAFLAVQGGIIGSTEWQRFERPICFLLNRAQAFSFNVLESDLRADFRDAISTTCKDLAD
jgi:hypothetical protein